MSERKKKKLEKDLRCVKELLETLRDMEKDGGVRYEAADFVSEAKVCLENLKDRETRPYAVLAISRICNIIKPYLSISPAILSEDDLDFIFESALKCIVEDRVDISEFASEAIFARFKNTQVILKFFEAYTKIAFNRETLKQILAMFIETNSKDREMLVDMVLKKYTSYLDFVPRIIKHVDVEKLDEDLYVKLYCDCQFFRENTEPRVVKSRKRRVFIEKAMDTHPEFVLRNYVKDRDQRVRALLAGKVSFSSEPYFNILLNDSEDDVRIVLLKRMDYSNVPLAASDRLLDKSARVREELFRIYRELVHQMRVFDSSHNLKMFEHTPEHSTVAGGMLGFYKEVDGASLDEMYRKFSTFFSKLSEGCLTCFSEEYISEIRKSNFSLEFLSRSEELPGLRAFLKSMKITDFSQIPTHLRSFCLEYMFVGTLNDFQIRECIQSNIYEALRFITDIYQHYDLLVEKALTLTDLGSVEIIVEFIKEALCHKPLITLKRDGPERDTLRDTIVDDSCTLNYVDELTANEIFINSHTKASSKFVEAMATKMGFAVDYPYLYFFVYKCRFSPDTTQSILKSKLNVSEKVRLLVYLNLPEALEPFVDLILRYELDYKTQRFILSRRTTTSALIYFLATGHVSISNTSFFIKAIKCCLASTDADKVEHIFKSYVKSVKEHAFNVFYSICWILKDCSVTDISDQSKDTGNNGHYATHNDVDNNDSLVLNPMIVESAKPSFYSDAPRLTDTIVTLPTATEENGKGSGIPVGNQTGISRNAVAPSEIQANENMKNIAPDVHRRPPKLRLTKRDKALQCICSAVIKARSGQCIDISFDPARHGFFRLSDWHVDMISHGQVTYE